MKCPYCGEQMKSGVIRYDSRSGLRWRSEEEKILIGINSVIPSGGIGQLTAAEENGWSRGSIPGEYCSACKKLIIETDIRR